jgi:hypothetical protein
MGTEEKDHIDTLVAEIAQVKASQQEFMLLFGKRQDGSAEPGEVHATLDKQIIMSPPAAKRLLLLLVDRLRKWEAEFGALDQGRILREKLMPTPQMEPPFFRSKEANEKAHLCLDLLRRLGARPAFERSFKVKEMALLQNRFLLGFEKDAVGANPNEKILQVCEKIGMPPDLMVPFMKNLPEASIAGFGFGENETTCIAKVYLEFGIRYYRAMEEKPDHPDPYLSHVGYKWDVSDSAKTVVTKYTCYPAFTVSDMLENISSGAYRDKAESPFDMVQEIVEMAEKRVKKEKFLFLGVGEEKNPRNSFDINIYSANLKVADIFAHLSDIFRFYGLPDKPFELADSIKTQTVGHLAGGIGRDGKSFLTLYCGE